MYWANMEDDKGIGRAQRCWKNEVKELRMGRRLSEMEGILLARDRKT